MSWDVYALGVTIFEMMVGATRFVKWIDIEVGPPQTAMSCSDGIKYMCYGAKAWNATVRPLWIKSPLYIGVLLFVQDIVG
jgi:hypothetical protein